MPAQPLSADQKADAARLKAIYESKKRELRLTQDTLASACGWESQGTVSQYLNGKIPLNLDAALKFAEKLQCSVSEFSPRLAETLSLSSNTQTSRSGAKSAGDESNTEPGPGLSGKVPLISWVQAGDWAHAADLLAPGEAFEWIDTTVTIQAHTFALRVTGDSMEPDFPAGMILVVEPEMDAQPGDFVIVKNGDDEATFKQLVRDGADLYLKPLNPRYPIKPLGSSRIVGVVREAVRKLR